MLYSPGFLGRPKADEYTLVNARGRCVGAAGLRKHFAALVVVSVDCRALQSSLLDATFLLACFGHLTSLGLL